MIECKHKTHPASTLLCIHWETLDMAVVKDGVCAYDISSQRPNSKLALPKE